MYEKYIPAHDKLLQEEEMMRKGEKK